MQKRFTTLRVNTIKTNLSSVLNSLEAAHISYETVSWDQNALILKGTQKSDLESLDIYQNGEIYVQNLSSMLPPLILNPQPNTDILDMAAAPGSKTTQLAALTNNQAHITACEMHAMRAERLKHNIEKQGATCIYVMVSDSRKIDSFFSFDSILLDSPCSGSGTLNLEAPNFEKYFTQKLIEKSVKTQKSLIQKAIQILKPGHEMVYSTCSILSCENEEIIENALRTNLVEIVPIDFPGISNLPLLPTKIDGTLCVCPTEVYEGFFVAKLRKKGG